MELSKQEMELFLHLPGLRSKNFFYEMFLIRSKGFKINFQNRKQNYPNRKWNYFSTFQSSDQKTYFTKCFEFGKKMRFDDPPSDLIWEKIETRLESKVFSLVKLCLCSKCLVLRFFVPRLGWAYVLNLKLLLCLEALEKLWVFSP